MPAELTWYVLRATGIVAWLLLTGSVVGGLALRTKLFGRRVPPPWLLDLHRGVSGLAVVFTGLHVAAVLVDPWIDFTWVDVLLPGASDWRPLPVAAGVLSMHLLAAIQGTSLLMKRVGRTWWRRIHLTAVPAWLLATGHLVTAGTDATTTLLGVGVLTAVGLVAFPFAVRVMQPRRRRAVRT